MMPDLNDIYEKICGFEATVKTTVEYASSVNGCSEIKNVIAGALNNIEKLTPRVKNGSNQLKR